MENHGHRFKPEHAAKLLSDQRREKLPPEKVLAQLHLKESDSACDLGAGNGYFTIPMARLTRGNVFAVDVEPKMLDLLKDHANEAGIQNIEYRVADIAQTNLPDGSMQKVFSSFVMHEVPDLDAVIEEIKRILALEGQVLILDWEKVASDSGPPFHERIPSEDLKKSFLAKGFSVDKQMLTSDVYALNLTK